MKLKNKVALITGSARGLGNAIAKELGEQGAIIIINDIDESSVSKAVKELKKNGHQADGFVANISKKLEVTKMIDYIIKKFGRIDILVNNAGGELRTPKHIEEIEENHWDLVLDVNLKGTFFCSQAVITPMKKAGNGKIINMSSIGGRTASIVTGVAYAAAKGGVISFTRRLAKEVGPHNITVNAVAPGTVISGERLKETWDKMCEEDQDSILSSIPLERLGTVEDQAKAVSFLASEDSKYITGTVLDVNGGRFMG